ncbi:hypothetical protein [Mycobacterium noviomagense]|uniref:Uncharacterized protein n=1 Tax=Mycobacterium noviomagense TaxID=459858 RepID=A0A7I7PIX0_9MYCO|nr:hypothetical protein [Mycobacterium noviomagense]BBY08573.1 hypothetical protein MNVI_38910 [Mycobacterium noviomagense]
MTGVNKGIWEIVEFRTAGGLGTIALVFGDCGTRQHWRAGIEAITKNHRNA